MKDYFSQNNINGVIFDCDGVLVDSEKLSCGALNVVFEKYFQVDIGTNYSPVIGKALKDSFAYYLKTFNIQLPKDFDLNELYKEKDLAYQRLARNKLKPFPGVTQLLTFLKQMHITVAVASSGTHEKIKFNLKQGKLQNYFTIITSADEVKNGKPNPDLFLLSAQKMNIDPKNCLVIEDSVLGIKAAKLANMLAIGVTNTFDEKSLADAGADRIVIRVDELFQLLKI